MNRIDRRRRTLTLLGALHGAGLARATFAAPAWPDRAVRIVSPLAPGGPNDVSARLIAEHLQHRYQVPFVVENRPGAGTRIGNESVARSAADGATLLYASAALAILPSLYASLPYDRRRDLVPITLAVTAPLFLVVNSELAVHDVHSFAAWARGRPLGVTFAGAGVATVPHLASELLFRKLKVRGRTVQFRGEAATAVELLAGRVDAMFSTLTGALPHLQHGRLRILAVASNERADVYPAAPTLAEQGVDGVSGSAWFGFLAAAGTSPTTVEQVQVAIAQVLSLPAVRESLARSGMQPVAGTPREFASFLDREAAQWAAVVREGGIKAE